MMQMSDFKKKKKKKYQESLPLNGWDRMKRKVKKVKFLYSLLN